LRLKQELEEYKKYAKNLAAEKIEKDKQIDHYRKEVLRLRNENR
jgi:response regulator of citrate/malate metabolism